MSHDTITILQSRGPRLAKTLHADGRITPYGNARLFDMTTAPLDGLHDLHALLQELLTRPDRCALRGAIADAARVQSVRRLLHDDPATDDAATLHDVPRHWLAMDLDGLPAPAHLNPRDLPACLAAALPVLPPAFRHCGIITQATASHGIKPGMRLRLWVWLDRAMLGHDIARWLRGVPCLDGASFRAAQVIYTAAPILEPGGRDPLPAGRLYLRAGPATIAPCLPPPTPRLAAPARVLRGGAADALCAAAFHIARQPEGNRHRAAVNAACRLARHVNAGTLNATDVAHVIAQALERAGKDAREGEAIAQWALNHVGGV